MCVRVRVCVCVCVYTCTFICRWQTALTNANMRTFLTARKIDERRLELRQRIKAAKISLMAPLGPSSSFHHPRSGAVQLPAQPGTGEGMCVPVMVCTSEGMCVPVMVCTGEGMCVPVMVCTGEGMCVLVALVMACACVCW